MVWAGVHHSSYEQAAESLTKLAEQAISPRRIRRQVEVVGGSRIAERDTQIESLQAMPLPERRSGRSDREAPELAVVMMDGGRYQRRDRFGESTSEASRRGHWRESKVGCFLSMQSETHNGDPCPQIPASFAHASVVQEIAKMAEKQAVLDATTVESHEAIEGFEPGFEVTGEYHPPELVDRDVVASGRSYEEFGWQLEATANRLNFAAAGRQAFVADGARANWRVQQKHFPDAVAIADLMHALSYAWAAAAAIGEAVYATWAQQLWGGQVEQVIDALREHQSRLGEPPRDANASDPRQRVHRALTYLRNNASHMSYPAYRQAGLPITSSHMESTVKLINRRIKGTEKFWLAETSEAVLQLKADYLSASNPLDKFWHRSQAEQSGSNCYHTAG